MAYLRHIGINDRNAFDLGAHDVKGASGYDTEAKFATNDLSRTKGSSRYPLTVQLVLPRATLPSVIKLVEREIEAHLVLCAAMKTSTWLSSRMTWLR